MISTEVKEPKGELYGIDSDVFIAREARKLGFPIGGMVGEIYEDAVILIPPIMAFDWGPNRVKIGRVMCITDSQFDVWSFVLYLPDNTQVPCMYGRSYPCFFALPEDTVGFCELPEEDR